MTASGAGEKEQAAGWLWGRWSTPASQWTTRRRVLLGVFWVPLTVGAFYAAVHGPHARGVWFAVFAVVVMASMYGVVLVAPVRYESWTRRHRNLDAAWPAPLLFLVLGFYGTSLTLLWCAVIAVAATALIVPIARHYQRKLSTK